MITQFKIINIIAILKKKNESMYMYFGYFVFKYKNYNTTHTKRIDTIFSHNLTYICHLKHTVSDHQSIIVWYTLYNFVDSTITLGVRRQHKKWTLNTYKIISTKFLQIHIYKTSQNFSQILSEYVRNLSYRLTFFQIYNK